MILITIMCNWRDTHIHSELSMIWLAGWVFCALIGGLISSNTGSVWRSAVQLGVWIIRLVSCISVSVIGHLSWTRFSWLACCNKAQFRSLWLAACSKAVLAVSWLVAWEILYCSRRLRRRWCSLVTSLTTSCGNQPLVWSESRIPSHQPAPSQ